MSRATLAAAAIVAVIALGGALAVAGPSPTPSALAPSPSLPGVVAPIRRPAPPTRRADLVRVPRSGRIWIATGSMGTPRSGHTAVRLLDGRVLVVGGAGDENDTSAELYDPDTGTWSATGNMLKPHAGFLAFPATLLRDGRVLVGDADDPGALDPIFGAEVYDPDSGTWTPTGKMIEASPGTATVLRDGRVLVTGSDGTSSQLYDPDNGTWTSAGKMVTSSRGHAATLLPDGKVLVVGGFDVSNDDAFDSAELYDPATGTWTAIAPMHAAKGSIRATLLPDGNVLVVGGPDIRPPTPPELYDSATGSWTVAGDPARPVTSYLSATLLSDGTVLLTDVPDAVLYDPGTGSWTATGTMLAQHDVAPSAALLLDGTVLVTGGIDCPPVGVCSGVSSAELYVPAGVSPPPAVAAPSPTAHPTPTPSPTPVPPQAGPVPPDARSWKVTVSNKSSEPATLFVAKENEQGLLGRACRERDPERRGPRRHRAGDLPPSREGWRVGRSS